MPRPSLKDQDESILSARSNLDWGGGTESLNTFDTKDGGPSRYDPKAMSRIVDITDLVDESSQDSDEDGEEYGRTSPRGNGSAAKIRAQSDFDTLDFETNAGDGRRYRNFYGGDGSRVFRQLLAVCAVVAIVASASALIGLAVTSNEHEVAAGGAPGYPPAGVDVSNMSAEEHRDHVERMNNFYASKKKPAPVRTGSGNSNGQTLLEKAERIMTACSESRLNEDMSECQSLCRRAMCCFEDPDSMYGCQDDPAHECAVHFGCEALMVPPEYTSYDLAMEEELQMELETEMSEGQS